MVFMKALAILVASSRLDLQISVCYTEQLSATPRKSSKLIEITPAWSLSRTLKASVIKHKNETCFKIRYKNWCKHRKTVRKLLDESCTFSSKEGFEHETKRKIPKRKMGIEKETRSLGRHHTKEDGKRRFEIVR
jgi:hypothetical protein